MPLPSLESLDAGLDRACADVLGDTIQYRLAGEPAASAVKAHVNYSELSKAFEGPEAIAQDITLEILKTDLPRKPHKSDRIELPRLPGRMFQPIAPRSDESGSHWACEVRDVADV